MEKIKKKKINDKKKLLKKINDFTNININFKYKNNKQRIEIFLNSLLKINLNNNQIKNKNKCYLIGCAYKRSFIFDKKKNKLFFFDKIWELVDNNNKIPKLNLILNNIIEHFNLNFSKIKKITIGILHSLILFENNELFLFGDHSYEINSKCGFCGNHSYGMNTQCRFCEVNKKICIPKKIKFFENKKISNIFCGSNNSFVLLENNELFSFGANMNGELGIGFEDYMIYDSVPYPTYFLKSYCDVPQKIKVNEKILKFFTSSISRYSFLLTKLNNNIKIYGFGSNKYNTLGIFEENVNEIFIPTIINSLKNLKIKKIFCGKSHTFVLENNNNLFGFGYNKYNQLGIELINEKEELIKEIKEIKEIIFFKNKNEKIKKISLNYNSTIFLTSFFILFFYFLFFHVFKKLTFFKKRK